MSYQSAFSQTATACATDRNPSQSQVQIDQLDKSVAEVNNLVCELLERLHSVSREQIQPAPSAPGGVNIPPEEYLVPIANRMRQVRKDADLAAMRLRSMIERLEA